MRGDSPAAPPCVLTILGASGDLTKRLLLPAIYNLASVRALPEHFRLLGVAQERWDDDAMRAHVSKSLNRFWGEQPDANTVDWIVQRTFYQPANLEDDEAYYGLSDRIQQLESKLSDGASNRLFYLALAPALIAPVARRLAAVHLFDDQKDHWRRLIVEKPFGHDLASAVQLTEELHHSLREDQIYRIDHFAGKEAVHDIAAVRFSNTFFDALWNRHTIDNVQITVAETLGVEKRGSFYEKSGALRDMVPNHIAELLSIVAMERPESRDSDHIRDKQVQLLQCVKSVSPEQAVSRSVRAQYTNGTSKGNAVPGYRQEPNVAPDSRTETYVALKIEIENDRWAGVPFYVRTGKRMAADVTEVMIEFQQNTDGLFDSPPDSGPIRHALLFRLKPDNGVHLEFGAKEPGMESRIIPVALVFEAPESAFGKHGNGYERLLRDAMMGNTTLFQREDFVEAGWRMVQPVLDAWSSADQTSVYAAGSAGPPEADELLARDGRVWRSLSIA